MPRYVRTIAEVDGGSLSLVGGKGANLGELVAAGMPVPAAFCVTTQAYRAVLERSDLPGRIADVLAGIDCADPAGIAADAEKIRALILAASTPEPIGEEIAAAYNALEAELGAGVAVAVRSSATAEDLPGMSFAGQQDTYLYISGSQDVLDAVKRCWASLWTDRAIAYRYSRGYDQQSVLQAVVVQEMFPSQVSGVMFTANPLTSNPAEFFINSSWGLGEAIVSGHVNPDQIVVEKRTLDVVSCEISDKLAMTVRDETGRGTLTADVPAAQRLTRSLSDAQLRDLCALGQRIEDHYGFYQDIEWGFADGRFAVLQAREITGADLDFGHELETWKTPTAQADTFNPRWTWSRAYSDEVQTGPSTPSFYTYLQSAFSAVKGLLLQFTGTPGALGYDLADFPDLPLFRWYGARAYYNLAFERERIRLFIPPFARTEAALWPFPVEEREEIRDLPFDWERFFGILRTLQETNPDVSLLGSTKIMYEGLERWTAHDDAFWADFDYDRASVAEILAEQMNPRGSRFVENVILAFTVYIYILPPALEIVCREWLDDEDGRICNRLLGGLGTKTAEENIALWRLSRSIASSPTLTEIVKATPDADVMAALVTTGDGRAFVAEFDDFIEVYGHRGGAERDAIHRRWRDDPALVFPALRLMLDLDEEQSPETHERRQRADMLQTRTDCIARLRAEPDDFGDVGWLARLHELTGDPTPGRAELFEWFLDLVQDWCYYRDFERFYNDKNMGRARFHYEAIGRKFVAEGLLTDVEDAFFLGREEMLAAAGGELTARQVGHRVRSRRGVYQKYSHQEPPKYIRGWEFFDDDIVDAEGALQGIGASSGVVTGTARVCRSLSEIHKVQPGDILVTVATDPGWTTVFSILGGVVVESGGVVAHAVMISREYGLPCVANLSRACEQIPDGATITIDGTRGRVIVDAST